MERSRRWEEMEADCLANIFGRLGLDDLTVSVPFVCMSWCCASRSPLCWRVLNFSELDFMPWSIFTKRFKARYNLSHFTFRNFMSFVVSRSLGMTTELRFPLKFRVSSEDLDYVANKCPRLKVLSCPRLMPEGEELVTESIAKLRNLEQLEMNEKPSWFPELARKMSLSCNWFSSLKISGAITEEDSSAIVNYLPKLRNLDLSNSYVPREQLLVILNGCKKLERFTVRSCIGFEADKDILHRASGIKMFEHKGTRLRDGSGYETDESDPFYVCFV